MLSQKELENFSSEFKIDKLTIFREYLQLLFLRYLYQEKESEKIFFKGGTCLHLLYKSPRFSEDLDLSTELSRKVIKKLVKKISQNIKKEISFAEFILVHAGKKSLRFKIKYQGKEFKYPLNIRVDFSFEKAILRPLALKVETKFPIFFPALILSLDKREILAEKIRAFLKRGKGRDVFDLWYLLSENIPLNKKLLTKKLKKINLEFKPELLLRKIKKYPLPKLRLDLSSFLPQPYRKIIPKLKDEVLNKISFEIS